MPFDISESLAPTSDQLDAVDLLGGPRTFTIEKVSKGSSEQPLNIHLAEFPRPWRPGKSMRRVLAACWTNDAETWVGHRVELYCEPSVRFGGSEVGGTRVRALSHIDGPRKVPLIVSRGKSAIYVVKPLPDAPAPQPARDYLAEVDLATDSDELRVLWRSAKEAGAMTDELNARIMAAQKALQEVESDA